MKYFKNSLNIIYTPKVKSNINIVNISDLHYSSLITEKVLFKIKQKIALLKPNYITITGDTIDSIESVENKKHEEIIINFFYEISNIAPVMLSLGNHDFYKKNKKKTIFDYPSHFWDKISNIPNVYLLDNQMYQNHEIEFFGYTQPKKYYYAKTKEEKNAQIMASDLQNKSKFLMESSVPKIALIHSPSCITHPKIIKLLQNFDLILSGHMHNGCVFPIIDEIWQSNIGFISASKKLFSHNCRGKIVKEFQHKTINIIICGAITTFSKQAPKLLHQFDRIYPYHINQIILTNNKQEEKKKTKFKYFK